MRGWQCRSARRWTERRLRRRSREGVGRESSASSLQKRSKASSRCLRELRQHLLLVVEHLLHAPTALHALEVRIAVLEPGDVELEGRRAPEAPEEIRIDGSEMAEEPFAPGEHAISDREVFE